MKKKGKIMSINYFNTDLTPVLQNKEFQIFAHGCNCFCNMGAGIAKIIKQIFPQVYKADKSTIYGDKDKLGTIDIVAVGDVTSPKFVINAYIQYDFGKNKINVDYNAVESCFKSTNEFITKYEFTELTIPKIGAGLAGGDWKIIEEIIKKSIDDKVTINVYYL